MLYETLRFYVCVLLLNQLTANTQHWSKVPECEGPHPPARYHHSTSCLDYGGDKPQLVIFGGRDVNGDVLNDVWILDINSGVWKEVCM